ncbi:acyltransferase family protein [Vibrio sp. WJH972]
MNRNIALDILKLSMALMIVGLHAGFLGDITPLGSYLTVYGVFRIAVPIFLLINGFYFYSVILKNNPIDWFKRIIILHIFWTVIYSYFWLDNSEFSLAIVVFKNVFIGYYHLWYLPAMLGSGVILALVKKASTTTLVVSIIISFLCGVIMQYVGTYHVFSGSFIDKILSYEFIYRNVLFFAYPFFASGFLINKHSLHKKISLKYTSILSVVGLCILIGESYINFYQDGRDGGFDILLSLIIACPFIFILFLQLNYLHETKTLALYSSSIYFVHLFILNLYRDYTDLSGTALTFITISSAVLFSYFVIKLNSRLKFIL